MHRLLPLLLAAAFAASEDHNLVVTVPGILPGAHDLELELARRGDAFLPRAWVMQRYSHGVAAARVVAQEATADGATVDLAVTSARDPWTKAWTAGLKLALIGEGGKATGTVSSDGKETAVDVAVAVQAAPAWPRPVGGAATGHPRLLLRPTDLPALERHLATPTGAKLLARLEAAAAVRYAGGGDKAADAHAAKFRSWPAIACAVLHHLTGEATWAAQARELTATSLADDGGYGIHMAPRLMGLALVYDLLAPTWDEAFRAQVAADLRRRIGQLDLKAGPNPRAMNLSDLSNHNAIRLGALGVAALALLGDGPDPALEDLLTHVQRRVRLHFAAGYGDTGFFCEGRFYKGMTLERGLGPFLWAHRRALGTRVDPPSADRYLLGDEVLAADPGDVTVAQREADGGHLCAAVALSLGAATVRAEDRGVLRWLCDRYLAREPEPLTAATREGEVLAAAWLPIAYPWDAQPVSPAEGLPPVACDRRFGRFVVRPAYGSAVDPLVTLNTRCGFARGGHDKLGLQAGLELIAAGGPLIAGTWLPAVGGELHAGNATLGGVVTGVVEGDRRLAVTLDLDRAFYQDYSSACKAAQDLGRAKEIFQDVAEDAGARDRALVERLCAALGGAGVVEVPERGLWLDHGVRARRAIAVDATGAGGLPLLVAIRDRVWIEGGDEAPTLTLAVPLPQRDLAIGTTDAGFTLTAPPAALGAAVVGAAAKVTGKAETTRRGASVDGKFTVVTETTWTVTLSGRGSLLTVLALGGDAPPAIAVEGGTVKVGERTLVVEGDRVEWR